MGSVDLLVATPLMPTLGLEPAIKELHIIKLQTLTSPVDIDKEPTFIIYRRWSGGLSAWSNYT